MESKEDRPARILVLYFSRDGHTRMMAELVAEGAGGRRHRIDTVLVRRLSKDEAHAQPEAQVESA